MIESCKELYKYKHMILYYTRSEIRNKYKGSILGIVWVLLQPIFFLIIYGFVFSIVMRIEMDNYFLFLFSGLLPWFFIRSSLTASTDSIVSNASLIKKIYFPREILPICMVLSNFVNFVIGNVVLLAVLLLFGQGISVNVLFFPLVAIVNIIFLIGLSLIISSVTVYLRDLKQIMEFIVLALFYFTPIIYTSEMVPERLRFLFNLNPIKPIIESYQNIFFHQEPPEFMHLAMFLIVSLASLIIGGILFKRLNKGFAEQI